MAYVKSDEFVTIALDLNCDDAAIFKYLTDKFPAYVTDRSKIRSRIANYRRKGLLPLASGNVVSTGELLKGTSTLYDDTGNVKLQWVKSDVPREQLLEAFQHAVDNIASQVTPIQPIPHPIAQSDEDLLVKIPIADAHIGLLTWHKEVGVDFDLVIAKELYIKAMTQLIDRAPAAGTCLLLDLGDTLHSDDSSNQTKGHKHQLDVDGRYDKLFDMALYLMCTMIDIALTKYPKVIFRKTRGNHDGDSSVALGAALEMRYLNEPRVTIERSPSLFWHYQFGSTLHFSTHGHTTKQSDLPEIAAADCRDIWSQCKFVYCDSGHVHHKRVLETRTAICECHNSLTAGDSFNFGHGYRSLRNFKAITYHKLYGEIGRDIITLPMLT